MTKSQKVLELLRAYESRNVTFIDPDGSWPIVWRRASGCTVWDAEGRKFLDLTGAFGVAAAGHANRRVVRAGQRQMETLLHAMGDVHPHECKARLARELSRVTFERWTGHPGKTIFCNSGFEAVEAALKTARLATGRSDVVAFQNAYHGLGYGALNATHRNHFREPFRSQLREFAHFLPFPNIEATPEFLAEIEAESRDVFRSGYIGAIVVEPIQVRGGVNIPPPGFIKMLRRICDEHKALLVLDEIYTGFGRTGEWFGCEHEGVAPDLICLGKALTGGFPLSACVGRAELMDAAWPPTSGEAIHTSTFLGHPVGCAMALAQIHEITEGRLVRQSAKTGRALLEMLKQEIPETANLKTNIRGMGLLVGIEFLDAEGKPATELSLRILKEMLRRGFILLPEGEHANVISFTPPLTITTAQLLSAVKAMGEVIREMDRVPQANARVEKRGIRMARGFARPTKASARKNARPARSTDRRSRSAR